MGKWGNCKICGRTCEERSNLIGIFCLLFGFPFKPMYLCSDECFRRWHGEGRVWFGRVWFRQVITTILVIIGIIAALVIGYFVLMSAGQK